MRKILLSLAALVLLTGMVVAQPAPPKPADPASAGARKALIVTTGLSKEQRQKNLESFDLVWNTIRDKHYDPKLGGVNWQKVREELRPRVEKADSMDDARVVMQEMLDRLGHSHVEIISSSEYEDPQGDSANGKPGK